MAKEAVRKEARGASALTLIKTARSQLVTAKDYESQGDLKGALSAFTKAASLAQMTMDTAEFASESKGKGGVLRKEFTEFIEGADLSARTAAVEEKLRAFEKSHPHVNGVDSENRPITKPGGSIADRMKALEQSGLVISTATRRQSLSNGPPPSPLSSHRFPSLMSPTPRSPISPVPPSPHSFVSPSTLAPSPSSSPSSSPKLSGLNLSEFNQQFPSIDELDEDPTFSLPSVPTGVSATGSNNSPTKDTTPLASLRNFVLPIERPSSTPITPTFNAFQSRPVSPSKPSVPLKPSGLSGNPTSKPPLPISNAALPKDLANYLRNYKVLLIDVRNREDFEREHIKADAVVCMEPQVLLRSNVTAEMLEDSMVLAPKEAPLFNNREKFDLVVVYDQNSQTFGSDSSVLSILVRAIYEQAFKKFLKRGPMILVGGMDAWKLEIGESEVIRGEPSSSSIVPPKSISHSTSINGLGTSTHPSVNSNNPFSTASLSSSSSSASSLASSAFRTRAETNPPTFDQHPASTHRPAYSLDQGSGHSRSPAEINYPPISTHSSGGPLVRRPAISRAPLSATGSFSPSIPEHAILPPPPMSASPSLMNGSSSITYPQFPPRVSPASPAAFNSQYDIASPAPASINPSLTRRRSSQYVDQSQEALTNMQQSPRRPSVDYPELSSSQVLRPPPTAASGALERQDNRPRAAPFSPIPVPRIGSDYPPTYWLDTQIGTSGLKNLGNTCYMNAPIQCLSATVPFARFFTDGRWKNAINYTNAMGSKGKLAGAFAQLVHDMWGGDLPYLTPIDFRKTICSLKAQYIGSDQHDSQEFLSFLLDGIHEDLNRIISKPVWAPTPEQEAELERMPVQIAVEQEWKAWKMRNDSIIVDYFQGQFRSRLQCLTCHKTSTTYNVFSILQLPIPHGRSGKVPLQRCLEALFNTEILDKDDAWDCPQCKVKRKATKQLSLARLPPILLIHLKRFEANGRFSDKIDTFVEFPMKTLDLTEFMPPPLPAGADKGQLSSPQSPDDPRTQTPPYKYDLYGVTNHIGNLSSGHYTSFIASRGGWLYCDDSSVKPIDAKQVVGQRAYVLFYKRTK